MFLHIRAIVLGGLISFLFFTSGFLAMISPLPLFYIALTKGKREGFITAALAMGLIFLTLMVLIPFLFHQPTPKLGTLLFSSGHYLFFVIIGTVLASGVNRGYSVARWITTTTFFALAGILVVSLIIHFSGIISLTDELRSMIVYAVNQVITASKMSGGDALQLRFLEERKEEIVTFVFHIIPALLFMISLITVLINALLGRSFITSRHQQIAFLRGFSLYRLPDAVIWGLIGCGLAFFLDTYIVASGWLLIVALNGSLSLGLLFFLQGLAVAVFFVQRLQFSLLRTIFYVVFILFLHTLGLFMIGLGIADVWGHFRERILKRST